MKIRAAGDLVFVQPLEQPTVSAAGLVILYDRQRSTMRGTILAIGPKVRAPREFTIGDAVIFSPDAGEELSFQQHVIIAIREADVLAVVEEQSHGRH